MITFPSFFAAETQVNRNGPETPLKFSSENPKYLLTSNLKNTPTYLNCHVSVKVDQALQSDLPSRNFYDDTDEGEDEGDEEERKRQQEVLKLYLLQYKHAAKQMNKSNSIPEAIPILPKNKKEKRRRGVRSVRDSLSYEWLKDDEPVIMSRSNESQVDLNGFTLFSNGTLKFQPSNSTKGEYRCKAKYIEEKFTIGPIISTSTVVEVASKHHLK